MTSVEILAQVNGIVRDVLDDDSLDVGRETTAKDVAGWDSLSHIQLVIAIEKHFRVRFTAKELTGFRNVGQMCQAIEGRLTG